MTTTLAIVLAIIIFQPTGNVTYSVDQNSINIYVSPIGNDAWSGNLPSPNSQNSDGPLKSLSAARDKIRTIKTSNQFTKNINVYLRNGTYFLTEPLNLDERDSGTNSYRITYTSFPGEIALISGGKILNNSWQQYSGNIYSMQVDSNFNSLFLGFERLTRARTPNIGSFYTGSASASSTDKKYAFNFAAGNLNSSWKNLNSIEIVSDIKWEQNRFRINTISGNKVSVIGGMNPTVGNSYAEDYSAGSFRYYVDNVFEKLDSPGEWYLDKTTSTLYYWPRNQEEIANGIFIAPKVSQLIKINGKKDNYVKNIAFENLIFAHTDWIIGNEGYRGSQAGIYITSPPALFFNYTNNSQFVNNLVTLTGAYAIYSNSGYLNISGNEFLNLGAGGIQVGKENKFLDGTSWPSSMLPELDIATRNTISNNKIYNLGQVFREGVAVWIGLSGYNTIENNLIYNGGYSGISVGWKWGFAETPARNNLIQRNIIHDVMQEINDGAAIYTLGKQTGTAIKYNFIYNIIKTPLHSFSSCEYCIQGIHMDEGSSAMVVHNNIIKNTFNGMVLNVGSGNDIHDNIFALQTNYILFWNLLKTTVGYNRFRSNSYYAPSAKGVKSSTPSDDATFSEYSFNQLNSLPNLNPDSTQGPKYGVSLDLNSLKDILNYALNFPEQTSANTPQNPPISQTTNLPSAPVVIPIDQSQTCTSFSYSNWSECSGDGIKTRNVIDSYPEGCSGGTTITFESCLNNYSCTLSDWEYVDSECTSLNKINRTWTKLTSCNGGTTKPSYETIDCNYSAQNCSIIYSEWNNCDSNGKQTRTIISNPLGCNYTNENIIRNCQPVTESSQNTNNFQTEDSPYSKTNTNEKSPEKIRNLTNENIPHKSIFKIILCRLKNFFNNAKYDLCINS